MAEKLIFCDFDGTILVEEIFHDLMQQFAPEASARVLPEIFALRTTLQAGLREVLGTIPSSRWPEMEAFVTQNSHLRAGFPELLAALPRLGWSLLVVTGGFTRMAERVLAPLRAQIQAIHGLEIDLSGPHLRVFSPWEDDEELVVKRAIYAQYHPQAAICIGDSVTDLRLARECPRVFARDRLLGYLRNEQRPCTPFQDFFDILHALEAQS
ncbi:haloacid dehalogenase-like hydrolase [Acidithiobacillus sp. IBUN Pt1247-S3]|uniref:haloacid dehalogenase-like hydrolase n=1 Tax=Acidithiobacillus sp. IBUN Pt1247-S3 TaxID=3166642 RepID=UPI0034E4C8A9